LWRCGNGLLFEVPPLASEALLTTLHPLLENVLQTVDHFKILPQSSLLMDEKAKKSLGARSELNSVFVLKKWIGRTPLQHPPYSPDLAPCDFWAFPTMKREIRGSDAYTEAGVEVGIDDGHNINYKENFHNTLSVANAFTTYKTNIYIYTF
jgi:hypothetical protein